MLGVLIIWLLMSGLLMLGLLMWGLLMLGLLKLGLLMLGLFLGTKRAALNVLFSPESVSLKVFILLSKLISQFRGLSDSFLRTEYESDSGPKYFAKLG